ncbi:MAG: monofunctional biosynthetic peptidoglycan transglycosylase [Burkholderiales bacterium]
MLKKFGRYAGWATALLFLLALLYHFWVLLHLLYWVSHNPTASAFMETSLERLREHRPRAQLKHEWVPYNRISNHLKRALIASEDARFVEHRGFDWEGIQLAYEKNMEQGEIVAGGSTISQQLAKNLFLPRSRTSWRKAEEAIITVMIEGVMSKRRILEIYMNVIEWGEGVFGAEAAARHYFGVNAAGLSAWQAAKLSAMVPRPLFYDAHRSTRYLRSKTATIQARMHLVAAP